MHFEFSDEQDMLRDSIRKLLGDRYGLAARQAIVDGESGFSRELWRQFAELGLLGIELPEAVGGLGGSALGTMVVLEEFGRRLVVEPYLETVTVAAGLLRQGGLDRWQDELAEIASGERIWTLAWSEPQGRFDLGHVATVARRDGEGYLVSGRKVVVAAAPWADRLIVSARTAGAGAEPDGVSLFVVDSAAPGLRLDSYRTLDGRRAADVTVDQVRLGPEALLGEEGRGLPLLARAADRAVAGLCAEAVGCMAELNRTTLDYARARRQFGTPIASFQVLQHRMVDMFIAHEEAAATTFFLHRALDEPGGEAAQLAPAAKVQVGEAGRLVGQQAVQIHGGMGMSEELEVGRYFKRLTAIDIQFGDADHHLARYTGAMQAAALAAA
ncbi:acyl-CoA dehydrogenase family protein [Chelatococcus reniformis]|uniref:Acyl-CoA dehydrogenase short-chain specific n=1 Tax=Chelatococcus reniformis TaxID=1494448 RepID=A0A916UST2_9HYPH|nr:acyl-CoA dehydrogenase family protein [Chelatococcus reniformis]GGC86692.1 acyl-CoA dehydrogenase short-chain specific [Chelatococcus reniformis]